MSFIYPSLLRPTDFELFTIDGETIRVPKVILDFKLWEGLPIANTFGGKPLVDFDGVPMFAELAVMKLFKVSGWEARWIETYGAKVNMPFHFSGWNDGRLSEQSIDMISNNDILKLLNEIYLINNKSYGGCWDVLGWHKEQVIFAEAKRSKKDKIRVTQNNWLKSGLKIGLNLDNFLIVQWEFIIC